MSAPKLYVTCGLDEGKLSCHVLLMLIFWQPHLNFLPTNSKVNPFLPSPLRHQVQRRANRMHILFQPVTDSVLAQQSIGCNSCIVRHLDPTTVSASCSQDCGTHTLPK